MVIITYREIKELCKNMYFDDGEITVMHSCFKGEKEFALCMIAKILALLERDTINDEFIIQYLQGLVALSKCDSNEYENFLKIVDADENTTKKSLNGEKLSNIDRKILKEMMMSNLAEYTFKSDSQVCCYSAMKVFFITTYCILRNNIDFDIEYIDMVVDLDDQLEKINIFPSDEERDFILVNWESKNKINSMYTLYKNQYLGLDNFSILELVSADVIAEDYYYKDERFSITPSILVKQYCSIIESEINQIIQLLNLDDKPNKHLMWNDMKKYVKKNNIELDSANFYLNDLLEEWHWLRNKASHGQEITKIEYQKISRYLSEGIFQAISQKKLDLQGIKLSPSVDEISKYMW